MKPTVMFSYNNGRGSHVIADALQIKRLKHHGSRFVANPRTILINWGGTGEIPVRAGRFGKILNRQECIAHTANKRIFFKRVENSRDAPRVVPWTENPDVAAQWQREGFTIVERHVLNGHAGAGIEVRQPGEKRKIAPLYTKYIEKDAEYRIHIVGGKVIFKQQKVRRKDTEIKNEYVRSLENGYIFREKVQDNMPEDVLVQSLKAMKLFDLDFGAVDVISKKGVAYVLEINSAPGIDPNSRLPGAYAAAFREYIGD